MKIEYSKLAKTLVIKENNEITLITNELTNSHINLKENANLTMIAILKKGWNNKRKVEFSLEGRNSKINFIAIIIGKNSNKFLFETISKHKSQNTNGLYKIRCVLLDESQINYIGNIKIEKQANNTDTSLEHHTLMLSKEAKTNTLPCLEIKNDNVKASHSATVQELNENETFYLKSRGIDKKQCEDIIIKGFLQKDIKNLKNKKIQQLIIKEIEKALL
jgi:Fe-S cluster assembly scaffold protein SufB